jgi:hypothetical protein
VIKPLTGNFATVQEFDHATVAELQPFFDIDFPARDIDEYRQYFHNLKVIAGQNLGLAHCVIHNQSARNVTQLARAATGAPCYDLPYATKIGSYSFRKPVIDEQLTLDQRRIIGVKRWASQINTASYLVLTVIDVAGRRRWIFVDLETAPHTITPCRDKIVGMEIARAGNVELNLELPDLWNINDHVSDETIRTVINFHNYQLSTNYMASCRGLLNLVSQLSAKQGLNVDYSVKTLDLQVRILESLWEKNLDSTLEPMTAEFWQTRDCQYQFGKKTLIDVLNFCLQIFNSNMYDTENSQGQLFRDALVFSSHMTNLYRNLEAPELNEVKKW